MIPGHTCNLYCRDGEHCDVVYVTPGTPRDALWQVYAANYQVWVTDAIPAREALPIEEAARQPAITLVDEVGAGPGTEPWAVWWRPDYAAARAAYARGDLPRYRSDLP